MKYRLMMIGTVLMVTVGMASAENVYDTIPNPDPSGMPSWGYQACSISELGDYVSLSGTARQLTGVRVGMVSWAEYDSDYTSGGGSFTDPDLVMDQNGWQQELTMNIYAVDNSGTIPAPGQLLATKTDVFTIPFAPGDGSHPFAPVLFDFSSQNVTLPDEIIFGLAFSTQTYGENPTGYVGPYNSLNVGAYNNPAEPTLAGTDIDLDKGFVSSTWSAMYGTTGTHGVFTLSDGEDFQLGYRPSVEIQAVPEPATIGLIGLGGLAMLRRRRNRA